MKFSKQTFVFVTGVVSAPVFAADETHNHHHYDEEIVVSAPFKQKEADTALPVNVLTAEDLAREVEDSLGETLKNQIGIHNTSFGPGVGQAVIRGQSGNRVQVLQNSVNNIDASSVSPDHVNGVEPALASRIEVVRGPSTLLYGNGAIGGIVNVIDNRIPETGFEQPEFTIEQSHNTVNEENKTVARFNASNGNLNFHFDGFTRDNDDVEIDGYAIDEEAVEREEAHLDDDHGDEHDEDDEEITNSRGFIANSDAEADGFTFGTSFTGTNGFIGFSASELNNEYGLPTGTHGHHDHEEEHHEEDEHDEDDHGEEAEGEENVRINMEQTRYDLKGEYNFSAGFIRTLRGSLNYTDYEHQEIEIEGNGTRSVGTTYSNEGYAGRLTMTHAHRNNWNGIWGIQFSESEFSALGAEAFIPETDSTNLAVFVVEQLDLADLTWEFGYRYEYTETDPGASCDRDEGTHSLSASVVYDLNESSNAMVALSRSERAPTLEERYSNVNPDGCAASANPEDWVAHAATGLLEIGNPDLDKEVATNIEFGFHKHVGKLTGEISLYYNEIADYIYLEDAGDFEETPIAWYAAEDATFYGLEGRLVYQAWQNELGELDLSLQGDLVRAEFDDAGDVPRIPPARIGIGLSWHAESWNFRLNLFRLNLTEVMKQDNTAIGESDTDGYTLLDLYADYHLKVGNGELLIFAKGSNLLDEEIRNHTSFLKNFAPEPGRGVRLGIRYLY
jgi:iron complex outermembrane receptor protein